MNEHGVGHRPELHDPAAVIDHNVVKVALCVDGCALMFSRQPLPYPHTGVQPTYLRQLGLYGFTSSGLQSFAALDRGAVEGVEGIEMLRLVEHALAVHMVKVNESGIAVDTPQDLERARSLLVRPSHNTVNDDIR